METMAEKIYYSIEEQINNVAKTLAMDLPDAHMMGESELASAQRKLSKNVEWVDHHDYIQSVPRMKSSGRFILPDFSLVLYERHGEDGLYRKDIMELLAQLPYDVEVFPIEIMANEHASSAMGFITVAFADSLNFDYDDSGLTKFIAEILDDMEKESDNGEYIFKGHRILLTR